MLSLTAALVCDSYFFTHDSYLLLDFVNCSLIRTFISIWLYVRKLSQAGSIHFDFFLKRYFFAMIFGQNAHILKVFNDFQTFICLYVLMWWAIIFFAKMCDWEEYFVIYLNVCRDIFDAISVLEGVSVVGGVNL